MAALHRGSPLVRKVFLAMCESVDSPFALGAWICFRDDIASFLERTINPGDYVDASSFAKDYMIHSFLSKWKGLDTGLDLEDEALRKFHDSEVACRETNYRIRESRNAGYPTGLSGVLHTAQRKIASLLGPYSTFKVNESYGWGPGATASISRRKAFVDTKLTKLPLSVTPKALPIIRQELGADLHWSAVVLGAVPEGDFRLLPSVFDVTSQCVIDTVPKNSKTHRVIAKEPTCNGFLQKGFGAFFRKRLKLVGVDLDDQSLNQDAARAAFDEGLATLDLKAASDTVALELVYELLPVDWAIALDDVRSPKALLPDGSTITLQKFSSMGNGFTFELESLIFWALASSVADTFDDSSRVWIYGDDIVVSRRCATQLVEVLSFCGFSVNKEKSFLDGAFFESCGKHYFGGYDVTPIYQKEIPEDDCEVIRLGNRLIRQAYRLGNGKRLDKTLRRAWFTAWRSADQSARFQLPLGTEGDDGWLLTADLFCTVPQDINLGLRCRVVSSCTVRLPANDAALLAWSLRRGVVSEAPFEGCVTVTSDVRVRSHVTPLRTLPPPAGGRWVMPTWVFGLSW
jgi:hypothetical protein